MCIFAASACFKPQIKDNAFVVKSFFISVCVYFVSVHALSFFNTFYNSYVPDLLVVILIYKLNIPIHKYISFNLKINLLMFAQL